MGRFRKWLLGFTAAAVALGIALAAFAFASEKFVFLCGGIHRRDTVALDLRGARLSRLEQVSRFPNLRILDLRGTGLTAEEYDLLTELLPNGTILWDVAFQGRFLPTDVQSITVTRLTDEDVAMLDLLPDLLYVDARECQDYPQLLQLQNRHPRCFVRYSVKIGSDNWNCHSQTLLLSDADPRELTEKLAFLPHVQEVTLTGQLPTPEEIASLQAAYPHIPMLARTVLGTACPGDSVTAMAPTEDFTAEQLEQALPYFPELSFLDLRGSGIADEDVIALKAQYPGITFLWDMTIAGVPFPTDAEEIDLSGTTVTDLAQLEAALPCFPNLKRVVMCGCGVDNETMDALDKRHENIRFIWSVNLGGVLLRTDATFFMPIKWGAHVTTADLYDLRYCRDIVCVDIGHMDVYSCEWAAFMPNLKYLLMADTKVSDLTPLKNLKNLIYLELFLTQVRDLTPLLGCTALQDINLCYTYAEASPLLEMPWLKNIWWSGHWAAPGLAYQMRQTNPDVRVEYTTTSSTGGGWRELPNYYAMRDLVGMGYMTG